MRVLPKATGTQAQVQAHAQATYNRGTGSHRQVPSLMTDASKQQDVVLSPGSRTLGLAL